MFMTYQSVWLSADPVQYTNGVNVDDNIVGSEFKWPTLIRDSALKKTLAAMLYVHNWMLMYVLHSRAPIAKNV